MRQILIICSNNPHLMDEDSNPTPRASLRDSCRNLKSYYNTRLQHRGILTSQIIKARHDPDSNEVQSLDLATLEMLTHDMSKLYFIKALKRFARDNPVNAIIICDYITAEVTEINIKQSTKEGKIKILIWLPNFHPMCLYYMFCNIFPKFFFRHSSSNIIASTIGFNHSCSCVKTG